MKNLIALIAGVALTALIGSVDVSLAAGTNKDEDPTIKVEDFNSSRSNVNETADTGDGKGDKPINVNSRMAALRGGVQAVTPTEETDLGEGTDPKKKKMKKDDGG